MMVLLPALTRKDLAAIVVAAPELDDATKDALVTDLTNAGLYGDATEDEIERLDNLI